MAEPLKLDPALYRAYVAWQDDPAHDPGAGASVLVHFDGDAEAISASGFEVAGVMGNEAVVTVRYADLERLSALPIVLRISGGSLRRPRLDTSAKDIHARATEVGKVGPGGNGLWFVDPATGAFGAGPAATGENVIVAIVDTGIDVTHPMFHKQISPSYDTRILRIWDQGATPRSGESGPASALLFSGRTYGVELDKEAIDQELNESGFPLLPHNLNHRDCDGHGTHVASIAAGGNTFFKPGGDAKRVGVAPRADIVVVKMIDTPEEIRDTAGNEVFADVRFRDALIYCLRVAREPAPAGLGPKPVVLNCSFGIDNGAGDGLEPDDIWLDERLDPTAAAAPDRFPKGAVVVKGAGNEGDPLERSHAIVTIPDSGQIDVPLELFDERGAKKTRFLNCVSVTDMPSVEVNFWTRRLDPPRVSFAVRVPTEGAFSAPVFAGELHKNFDHGKFRQITVTAVPNVQRPNPAGGTATVRRTNASLFVEPSSGTTPLYALGIYDVRISGPRGTVLYAKCEQPDRFGFRIAEHYRPVGSNPPDPLPPAQMIAGKGPITPIDPTTASTIFDAGGRNVITVAAYDDVGHPAEPPSPATPAHGIAGFSSRGPLRDFTDAELGPAWAKPDVAAPGVEISAALSKDSEDGLLSLLSADALGGLDRFEAFQGTSMAAPHVSGAIALMLQKKGDLNVDDVRTVFNTAGNTNPGSSPPPGDPLAPHAYGAGMVDALKSHGGTP